MSIRDHKDRLPRVNADIFAQVAREVAERAKENSKKKEVSDALRGSDGPLNFVETLIRAGTPADVGRPLTFEGRHFWRDIYNALDKVRFCVSSSAQVGKSIMLLYGLGIIPHMFAYKNTGIWHGLYLPTQEMVRVFSKGRLRPILNSIGRHSGIRCGDMKPEDTTNLLGAFAKSGQKKKKKDEVDIRDSYNFFRVGQSFVYLAWMKGMLRDALPLDVLWFDEVRLMDGSQVDRVEKRVSGSTHGWIGYTSTAGLPGDAIDVRWIQSDQRRFHNFCKCPDGVQLNRIWPNCLATKKGVADPRRRYYLFCPKCGTKISDRGYGYWKPHNALDGFYPGWNPHQLMTGQPLWKIVDQWQRANRSDFFNQVLGLPFIDEESCPITLDILEQSVNPDLIWATPHTVRRTAMGIDQMGQNNYFVIAEKTELGQRRIVHVEIVWDPDPFKRAAELMREYHVTHCVVEGLPNYNDAIRFANAFPSRVWIASYSSIMDGDLRWGDRQREGEIERKAGKETRTKWTVTIDQTKMLDGLAQHYKSFRAEMPDPDSLVQTVLDSRGKPYPCQIVRNVFWDHLRRIARRHRVQRVVAEGMDQSEETGVRKYHWVKLARAPGSEKRPADIKGASSDPHFAYADALCWAAWSRMLDPSVGGVEIYYAN